MFALSPTSPVRFFALRAEPALDPLSMGSPSAASSPLVHPQPQVLAAPSPKGTSLPEAPHCVEGVGHKEALSFETPQRLWAGLNAYPPGTLGPFSLVVPFFAPHEAHLPFSGGEKAILCRWDSLISKPLPPLPQSPSVHASGVQHFGDLTPKFPRSISRESWKESFHKLQRQMVQGEAYLANLTRTLPAPFPTLNENEFVLRWLEAPSRFGIWFDGMGMGLRSFSPERFVHRSSQGLLRTEPIKGTWPDSPHSNPRKRLWRSAKERSEHLMVTDLLRHDLNAVCLPGSVVVRNPFQLNSWNGLWQMQTTLEGQLPLPPENAPPLGDLLQALLPGGSISGTPKKKVCELLKDLEPQRGYYTGVFLYGSGECEFDGAVLIRSLFRSPHGPTYVGVGCGITTLSQEKSEWRELHSKLDSFEKRLIKDQMPHKS